MQFHRGRSLAAAWAVPLAAALIASPALSADPTPNADTPPRAQLLCGADRPLVHPGESVVVRAWLIGGSDDPAATRWRWQAPLGSVQGADVATWRFSPGELPVAGSRVTATVEAAGAGSADPPLRCKVDIVLAEMPEPAAGESRGADLNAHAFLVEEQDPPAGYGMYSYLLLDAPATEPEERQRHLNAVALYLTLVRPAAEMRAHLRPGSYNLALLPVLREIQVPQGPMDMAEALALARQVLQNYNYGRAQRLLADFCVKPRGSGPYIIASRDRGGCRRPNVLMDLSEILPDLVIDWIKTFRTMATAERSWGADTLTTVLLNTRNVIARSYRGSAAAAQDLNRVVRLLDAP